MSSEKCWIGGKTPEKQRSSCSPMRCCERWFWISCSIYSLNKDHQHLKWQPPMDIISRLPGCNGQAADAVSAYTQVQLEDAHKLLKIPKSECPDNWIRLPRHKWPKIMVQHGRPSRSSCTKSVRSSFGRTVMGKAIWERPIETWMGENSKLGMSLGAPWKRIVLICVCGWHKIGWQETKSWSDVETTQQRSRFGRTNIFPGSRSLGLHSKTPWTSLICVSSPKCVCMCVKRCPSQTPNTFICVSPNALKCVSPNAFICVSPNVSADATELASLAHLCSLRSHVF